MGDIWKRKKTSPFHEALVVLNTIPLIKAHAQKLINILHSDLEYPLNHV